ncbi:MAG: ParA family protein [Prevotella sp.]|jgi:cellulose biosynthesis protein BcsQ|nr:ParA family protein [Prevotella sp.]
MESQAKFVAISNQKGGVGKSAFTVLLAGYFHYVKGKNVLVVDCDYPQFSIHSLRERDKQTVAKNDGYKQLIVSQFSRLQKKAYPVITASPEEARDVADNFLETSETAIDVVFFDLPGTVNAKGIFRSIINMDYIFTPIVPDRMAMQSSMSFVATIQDYISLNPGALLKEIHVFWNRVSRRTPAGLVNIYGKVMRQLKLRVLETKIPDTNRYGKELTLTGQPFFRCTLLPPPAKMLSGSNLDALAGEIMQIIKP